MIRHMAFLALSLLPFSAGAQVVVSEIMYDLPGADTKREWIEIHNTGSAAVDLMGWKLFEASTNHAIATTTAGQSLILGADAYAIIADNPTIFFVDWPKFNGALFDSTFSLSNTGETLVLRDATTINVDTATYNSDMGAAGDGNVLVRSGTTFVPQAPTPGSGESASPLHQSSVPAVPAVSPTAQNNTVSPRSPLPKVVAVAASGVLAEASPRVQEATPPDSGVRAAVATDIGAPVADDRDLMLYLIGLAVIIVAGVGAVLFWKSGESDEIKILE